MAYASVADVKARSPRTIDATSKPNENQVTGFLEETAAEIDGILAAHDYQFPITGDNALKVLKSLNATGAWARSEQAAYNSPVAEQAHIQWLSALKSLREGHIVLDAPRASDRSRARSHEAVEPRFSLNMEL